MVKGMIHFPVGACNQDIMESGVNALIRYPGLTNEAIQFGYGFTGIVVTTRKRSTIKACATMLRHWGYID